MLKVSDLGLGTLVSSVHGREIVLLFKGFVRVKKSSNIESGSIFSRADICSKKQKHNSIYKFMHLEIYLPTNLPKKAFFREIRGQKQQIPNTPEFL